MCNGGKNQYDGVNVLRFSTLSSKSSPGSPDRLPAYKGQRECLDETVRENMRTSQTRPSAAIRFRVGTLSMISMTFERFKKGWVPWVVCDSPTSLRTFRLLLAWRDEQNGTCKWVRAEPCIEYSVDIPRSSSVHTRPIVPATCISRQSARCCLCPDRSRAWQAAAVTPRVR